MNVPSGAHVDMSYRTGVDEVFVTFRQMGHLPVVSVPQLYGIQIVPHENKHHHVLANQDASSEEVSFISGMVLYHLRGGGREVLKKFLDVAFLELNFEYSE